MNNYNQPPETDIPLAFAFSGKETKEDSPVLDADKTDIKAIKKREAALHETEIDLPSDRPSPPKLKILNIIQFPTPGQNIEKNS